MMFKLLMWTTGTLVALEFARSSTSRLRAWVLLEMKASFRTRILTSTLLGFIYGASLIAIVATSGKLLQRITQGHSANRCPASVSINTTSTK